jgi:hypothetical protein
MFKVVAWDYGLEEIKSLQFDREFLADKCAMGLWKTPDKYRFVEVSENGYLRQFFANGGSKEEMDKVINYLIQYFENAVDKKNECLQLCDY